MLTIRYIRSSIVIISFTGVSMFAKILVQVPDNRADEVRAYVAYYLQNPNTTIRNHLESQLIHLRAAFGPECISEILEVGMGDPTG